MSIRGAWTLTAGLAAAPTAIFAQAAVTIPPYSVISVASSDWNGDGVADRAILAEGEEGTADLYVYLSAPAQHDNRRRELALLKRSVAWDGGVIGQQPSIEINPKISILLRSGNDSIGRNRWKQTIAIAYRGDQFVVAGVTYSWSDTLDPSASGDCNLNLLTGRGTRNGKRLDVGAQTIPLSDWTDERRPRQCRSE